VLHVVLLIVIAHLGDAQGLLQSAGTVIHCMADAAAFNCLMLLKGVEHYNDAFTNLFAFLLNK